MPSAQGELSVGYVALNWMKSNPNPPTRATDQTYLALHCNGDLALRRSNGTLLKGGATALLICVPKMCAVLMMSACPSATPPNT